MAENLNLKKTIILPDPSDATKTKEFNINAVKADVATQTQAALTITRSIKGDSTDVSEDFNGKTAKSINYVPSDGGKFTGPVLIDNKYAPTEDIPSQAIINYGQINNKISDLTGAPLFTLDDNYQIHSVTDANNSDYKLNTLIGTSFNFESIKRIQANPNGSNGIKYEALIKDDDTKTYKCKVIGLDDIFDDYVVIPPTFEGTLVLNAGETTVDVTRTWTVTEIAKQAFSGKAVKSVILPNSIEVIGSQAFMSCAELVSINIPDKVTMIGNSTFSSCTKLKNLKLGTGITKIDSSAFAQCSSLESVIIPEKVTAIKSLAFNGSKNLASVVIPSSVTELGEQIFDVTNNPVNLTIYYTGTAEQWTTLLTNNTKTNKRINAATTTVIYNHKISNDIPVNGDIFNYTEFINKPILYICKDTETTNTPASNKIYLKLPDRADFIEISKGAARLETPEGATTQGYYTYETLAAIIAGINSRLAALGSNTLALPTKLPDSSVIIPENLHVEVLEDNFDPDSIPTIEELQEQLTNITGLERKYDPNAEEEVSYKSKPVENPTAALRAKADEDGINIKKGYYHTENTDHINTIKITYEAPTTSTSGNIGDILIVVEPDEVI